jgi:tetratricopeptide (TPR) repeat protein
VLAFGDVWLAQHRQDPLGRIDELRRRAAETGRDIPVDVIGVPPDSAALERYAHAGVRRVTMWAPSAGRSVIEAALDRFEHALAAHLDRQGHAYADLAEVHRLGGKYEEASAALEQSLARFERKGNLVMAERVRARLAELQETV